MKTFIIKNGKFVDKESGELASSFGGKLKSIAKEETESGVVLVVTVVKEGEEHTLRMRYFKDAALKILRCLYNASSELAGNVNISLEEREGERAKIVVEVNEQAIAPVFMSADYACEKKAFTEFLFRNVAHALSSTQINVLVYADKQDVAPQDAQEIAARIIAYRTEQRTDQFSCGVHVFTSAEKATGYLECLHDLQNVHDKVVVIRDAASILLVKEALTAQVTVPDANEEPANSGENEQAEEEL